MANVIREDVIQIGFDIQNSPIEKLNKEMENLKKTIEKSVGGDPFDDFKDSANETINPLEKQKKKLDEIKKKLTEIGKKAVVTAYNGLKKLAGISFKAMIAGIGAAAGAIGGLVYKATMAYADFEQLTGGVEKLFGEASDSVMKYANDAYKTAGLSANEYMETVTSFSASLISSLGGDTAAAADLANMAIGDMSDNANVFGSDMESIIQTYQSLAKGNYAMLDNLKLGYGGTKTEMERLIKDAAKLDKSVDANSMSFGNMVKAINVIQKDMGIYGTTSKEAAKTVSGSLNAMKSSWSNLLIAIGSGENLDQCFDNFINSIEVFGDNIMPVMERALGGLGKVIDKLVPKFAEKFPEIAEKLIPPLIRAAVQLAAGLIKALPTIIKTIAVTIVEIFGEQFPIIKRIGEFFANNSDSIGNALKKLIPIVIALVGAFKGFKAVKGISAIFGGGKGGSGVGGSKGGVFGGITNTFKDLAKTNSKTILKGMANLGIILGGFMLYSAVFAKVAPLIAEISDLGSLAELGVIMLELGAVGTALAKMSKGLRKIKVTQVLKGLANMGIILAGGAILTVIVGAVSLLKFDYSRMLKLTGLILAIGTVAAVLAGLAAIIGMVPIPIVIMGLASMAIVFAGITALIVAFGALTQIDGFTYFIEKGAEIMVKISGAIGEMIGSFAGGIAEGIASHLPDIGKSLSDFAINLEPMFGIFDGADMSGIGAFFSAFGGFMLTMAGNDLISFFTGGTDFENLGQQLTTFAKNSLGFFSTVATIPDAGFTGASKFFQSLSGIGALPNSGGVAGWFCGDIDYAKIADGIKKLSSDKIIAFYNTMASMPASAFTGVKGFFGSMSTIGGLPNSGGVAGWFCGDIDYTAIADGIKKLSSPEIIGFYNTMAGMKASAFSGVQAFFGSMSAIGGLPNSGGVAAWFAGDQDYGAIAEGIKKLSDKNIIAFYNTMAGMKASAFSGVRAFFGSLSAIGGLPNSGGIVSWFTGDQDYGSMATGIKQLSDKSIIGFFNTMAGMKASAFTGVAAFFGALSAIGNIEKSDGLDDWFDEVQLYQNMMWCLGQFNNGLISGFFTQMAGMKSTAFTGAYGFFKSLKDIASIEKPDNVGVWFNSSKLYKNMKWCLAQFNDGSISGFFSQMGGLSTTAFSNSILMFQTLVKIGDISQSEGIGNLGTVDLSNIGSQLKQFGIDTQDFFVQVNNLNVSNLDALWDSLKKPAEISTNISDLVSETIDGIIEKVSELPTKMGESIKEAGTTLSEALVSIWEDAVKETANPINKLIEGANFILKELGSEKQILQWIPYAKGTNGHRGGNALVNDGRGAELIQMPNGRMFIPRGRNVFLPNAPQGMKVLSAENTARLLGRTTPTFNYADGNTDVWSFIDNSKGLVDKIVGGIGYNGMSSFAEDVGKGIISTASTQMTKWVDKMFSENGGLGLGDYVASKGVNQWRATVIRALKMENLYSDANVARTLMQMQTESGGNPRAINLWDINAKNGTPSKGLMQVIDPTFKTYARSGFNKNIYDPLSNILASVRYAKSKYGSLTKAYRGVGYSEGVGEVTFPSQYRSLNMAYTPENSYSGGRTSINENNSYSPVFNFNINGNGDTRATAMAVKQAAREALNEMIESMNRQTPVLQEF